MDGADHLRKLTSPLRGRSIKLVGLGGVGSPVAQALTQFLGVSAPGATLFLIDGDTFEEKNRARMVFQAGGNKAVSKAQELACTCHSALTIVPVPKFVTPHNVHRLFGERDIVLSAVDNHSTRRCLSNRCRAIRDVVLISAGNDGIEGGREGTFGNVMIYERIAGCDVTSPLTKYHREIARPRDKRPDELGCMAIAQSSPQLLFTNLAAAAAMLGTFYAWLTGRVNYEEVFFDIALGRMQPVRRGKLSFGFSNELSCQKPDHVRTPFDRDQIR
jgi:ThiF family